MWGTVKDPCALLIVALVTASIKPPRSPPFPLYWKVQFLSSITWIIGKQTQIFTWFYLSSCSWLLPPSSAFVFISWEISLMRVDVIVGLFCLHLLPLIRSLPYTAIQETTPCPAYRLRVHKLKHGDNIWSIYVFSLSN